MFLFSYLYLIPALPLIAIAVVQLLSCDQLFVGHGLQHFRFLCRSLSAGVCPNSCPFCWRCFLTTSFFATLFSFDLQSSPASGSFPVGQLFTSGSRSAGASASTVLPMNIQSGFPLRLTGLISLQIKGLSRVFSKTTI